MSYTDVLAHIDVHDQIMPISVDLYHKFCASGWISEKTELIEGIIFKKMSKPPLHEYIAQLLHKFFAQHLSNDYLVRKEGPLTLAASEPEPDISIVKGSLSQFMASHPSSAELVIEVALSSLEMDRSKAPVYAAANIPEYWIIMPNDRQIERYRQPLNNQYQIIEVISADQTLDILDCQLVVSDLFQ